MSVSSRKTTNQSYKRESFPYPSHQPSSGTIQDGMTGLAGTNSIPLATGGTASVPSAANSISPHTASYLSTGPTLTASGTHIPGAAYHLPHGSASSSQPALALSSHSQGPTPASTPPTVPNETKGPGQYQNYTHTMNQHPLSYGRIPSQAGVIINNNPTRGHNQPRLQQVPRHYLNVNTINPGGHPLNYSIGMLPSAVLPNSSASATNIIPNPNYQLPGTGGGEHNLVFLPTPGYSTYYNNPAVRGAWPSATNARAATQNVVQVGQASTIIPSTPPYLNINSVPSVPQQQPIQQHVPAVSSTKSRSKALKIIDPSTMKEINVNDDESAKPDKKDSPNDAKRPSESLPSSGYSSSSSSMTFTNKEQSQSVLNGTAPNAPFVQSTNEWKGSSHSGVASGFSQADASGNAVVNSIKPANVPTSIQSPKMDYKKPTREEQPSGDVQPDDSKLRDKQTSSSWPETPSVQPTIVTPAQSTSQRGVPPGTKKPLKEAEATVSNSSSVSSTPVSSVPPTILTTTVPSDGVNKSIVTTSTIGIEDPENGSKKTTKQGIQGGIVGVPKDGIPSTKPTIGKPPLATATSSSPVAVVSSNQSLPETIQTTTLTGVSLSSAQNSVTKTDSKSQSSVPPPATAGVIPGTKPPATALSTSGPNSEKSSPILSSSTPPPDMLSASKSTSVANASLEKGTPAPPAKDEKSSPSAKPKRSGKDQSSEGSAHEHSNANAKGKTAQTVSSKQHSNDFAKPSASAPSSSVPAKQTNGETAEPNNAPEGKSKKKKGSSKKELNKKGQEKEGSDMDMFTKLEQTPTLPEKGVRAEKVPQPNPQPLAVNTNSNNRSKINSSQKSENISSVNSLDTKEKVISSQNIPVVSTVPAQPTDTNKTENIEPVEDTKTERKKYSVKFMLGMRSLPQCQLAVNVQYVPVTLPQLGGSGSRGMSQNGFASGGGGNFLPNFMAQSGPSLAPRKSQQNSMRRDKPNQIHVSLSLREEVPLRRSKDAWKPAIFSHDPKSGNDEEKKTEALFKAARGILNKLTPEKFPTLIEKFKLLPIDSLDRLRGVIDLIFEKAIDEPGFCKWYAEMCNIMQNTVVDDVDPNGKAQTFRTVLLNKCQNQFESAKADEADAEKKRAEMSSCTDPERKKELQLVYEEKERKARRKSVGNCRFIGELFKLRMLTPKIVVTCIRLLISQLEEESLECLCKLLTTIGKEIDEKLPKESDSFFKRMQEIADQKKTPKISSRIRFMILDVIDLRKNRWVPRRETDNPKTIDQMNMEMEKKEHEQKIANMTMRKSHDDYRGNKDSRKNRYDNQSNDNSWTTVTNKNSNTSKLNYKVDGSKFANIASTDQKENLSLGNPHNFSMWRSGSGAGSGAKPDKKSVLSTPMNDRMDATRSSSVSSLRNSTSGKLTPSSSLERPKPNLPLRNGADDPNKMSRSSSAQSIHPASRESSVPRAPPSRNASQSAAAPTPSISPVPTPSVSPLPDGQAKQFSETIFNEYVNNHSLQDTILDVSERLKANEDKRIAVEVFIDRLLEKPEYINDCAKMVTALIEAKVLPVPVAVEAVSTYLQMADDLKYDYPKFWEYMGNFLSGWPLVFDNCQVFNELKTVLQKLPNSEDCSAVLSQLEKTIRNNKGRILEFLSQALDTEEYDNVFKWINENVDSPNRNPNLVVALTEAVCEAALKEKYKSEDIKEKYGRYFKKYIDNEETLELKCLNTIVDFSRRKEHPQGLILYMFEGLYDSKALSSDSFMQLKNGPNKEELGVALTIAKTLYDYLEDPVVET